jgi:hypothetical protein
MPESRWPRPPWLDGTHMKSALCRLSQSGEKSGREDAKARDTMVPRDSISGSCPERIYDSISNVRLRMPYNQRGFKYWNGKRALVACFSVGTGI